MRLGTPFEPLHEAMAAAVHIDLPDIEYWQRDWKAYSALPDDKRKALGIEDGPGETKKRRPQADETAVIMFSQTWSSTACGYGGIGGAAMTPAYTVIVSYGGVSCVYFGCGRLAYRCDHRDQTKEGRERWDSDIAKGSMASCADCKRYD